jgi:hypothetical protein
MSPANSPVQETLKTAATPAAEHDVIGNSRDELAAAQLSSAVATRRWQSLAQVGQPPSYLPTATITGHSQVEHMLPPLPGTARSGQPSTPARR